MIRHLIASLALGLMILLSGGYGARAQDFLQELFGPDPQPTNSRRLTGHGSHENIYRGGPGRERFHSRSGRARGQWPRTDDASGSGRSYEGGRNSRTSDGAGGSHREDDGASWGNGSEFCVRTCDGYFFPLIKSAQQTKQASCEYACPSAPVAYYHGASIETARNLNGEKYASLPTAFKFREKVSPGCTCHPPEESQQHSLKIVKNDPTAHSGDIVVEQRGAFVYQGKQAVPIDRSHQVSASVRQNIHKMTAGPTPHVIDQAAQNSADASSDTDPINSGLLTGAARPMGELDAAAVSSGDAGQTFSWAIPVFLLLLALSGASAAALILMPGIKERLAGAFRDKTPRPTAIDVVDADVVGSVSTQAIPLAWVWSAYQGSLEPVDTFGGGSNVLSPVRSEDSQSIAGDNPALLFISALPGRAMKTLRLTPNLKDRLMSFF